MSLPLSLIAVLQTYAKPGIQAVFTGSTPPPLYLTHPIPQRPLISVRFCPFQDILTVGHSGGLSSVLVPGSGEPNFDSSEADPFENKRARREREVKSLLDKVSLLRASLSTATLTMRLAQIQPDMITLDPEFVGSLAPPTKLTTAVDDKSDVPFARLPRLERLRVSGKADETEEADASGDDDADDADESSGRLSKAEKEKKKMRGKNKSLKRSALPVHARPVSLLTYNSVSGTSASSARTSSTPKPYVVSLSAHSVSSQSLFLGGSPRTACEAEGGEEEGDRGCVWRPSARKILRVGPV